MTADTYTVHPILQDPESTCSHSIPTNCLTSNLLWAIRSQSEVCSPCSNHWCLQILILSESHQDLEPPTRTGCEHQRNWQLQRGCPTSSQVDAASCGFQHTVDIRKQFLLAPITLQIFYCTYIAFCIIHHTMALPYDTWPQTIPV